MKKEILQHAVETGQYPRYIYRYMPINNQTILALKEHYLWFSSFASFNDPYEGKIRVSKNYAKEDLIAFFTSREHMMTEEDKAELLANPNAFIEKGMCLAREGIKICCFSTICDNLLMWAHYADKHKGICLQFDITEDNSNALDSLMHVQYTNVNYSFNYIHDSDGYIRKLVCTKALDWAYEKEIRVSKPVMEGNICYYNPRMLKSVILGCKSEAEDIEKIKQILPEWVELKQCVLNDYAFKIDIKDL